MKRMTRKQYIEKFEEYIRELPDMDEFSLEGLIAEANLKIKSEKNQIIFLRGMEAGLQMARDTIKDL